VPVEPQKPEKPKPRPDLEKEQTTRVQVRGRARIYDDDLEDAKRRALLDAYRQAVNKGVGVKIEEFSQMRNLEGFIHIVTARSAGHVKTYKITGKPGPSKESPSTYVVCIDAEVAPGAMKDSKDIAALKLFVQALGSPRVLFVLEPIERKGKAPAPKEGGDYDVASVEGFLAARFFQLGYRPLTSSELEDTKATRKLVAEARQGKVAAIRELGIQCDADLVVSGSIRVSVRPCIYGGKDMHRARTTVLAKAIFPATGEKLAVQRTTKAEYSYYPPDSVEASARRACETVATRLAWAIPEVLGSRERCMSVRLVNCSIGQSLRFGEQLSELPGVRKVVPGSWVAREKGAAVGTIEYRVVTAPVGPTGRDLFRALSQRTGLKLTAEVVGRLYLRVAAPSEK